AEEEASVTDDQLEGQTVLVLDGAAQAWAHDHDLVRPILDLIENVALIARDTRTGLDLIDDVTDLFLDAGAPLHVLDGIMTEQEADDRLRALGTP
ncbi:MAG: hypothetical protein R2715_05470, partial [Ilumatobacteraceae bacterium]